MAQIKTIIRPGIEIQQEFIPEAGTIIEPDLPAVMVGVNRQIVADAEADSSYDTATATGSGITYSYPDLASEATVDTDSVSVKLSSAVLTIDSGNNNGDIVEDSETDKVYLSIPSYDFKRKNVKAGDWLYIGENDDRAKVVAVNPDDWSKVELDRYPADLTDADWRIERTATAAIAVASSFLTAEAAGFTLAALQRTPGDATISYTDVLVEGELYEGSSLLDTDYPSFEADDVVNVDTVSIKLTEQILYTGTGALASGTLTKTGAFTDAVLGDKVRIAATDYRISSITSANAVVIASPPADDSTIDFELVRLVQTKPLTGTATVASGVLTPVGSPSLAGVRTSDYLLIDGEVYGISAVGSTTITLSDLDLDVVSAAAFTVIRNETGDFSVPNSKLTKNDETYDLASGIKANGTAVYQAAMLVSWSGTHTTDDVDLASANVLVSYNAVLTDRVFSLIVVDDDVAATMGTLHEDNVLAIGALAAKGNTAKTVLAMPLPDDASATYLKAFGYLEPQHVYTIVPLVMSVTVASYLKTHVQAMSQPEQSRFRIGIFSLPIPTESTLVEPKDGASLIAATVNSALTVKLRDVAADFSASESPILAGDWVLYADSESDFEAGTLTIAKVTSVLNATDLKLANVAYAGADGVYTPKEDVTVMTGVATITGTTTVTISEGTGLSDVDTTDLLVINGTTYAISSTSVGDSTITAAGLTNATDVAFTVKRPQVLATTDNTDNGLYYEVIRSLDKDGQADAIALMALSFNSRRLVYVTNAACVIDLPKNGVDVEVTVPGYVLAAALAGLTVQQPPHQGFTNFGISGIKTVRYANTYFKETQLGRIAGSGGWVFIQDTDTSLPYAFRQTTTDTTNIKTTELSVTRTVDFYSFTMKNSLFPLIGVYNIYDATLTAITNGVNAVHHEILGMVYNNIGAPLRSATLISLIEDPDRLDAVKVKTRIVVPIPLNKIQFTVAV